MTTNTLLGYGSGMVTNAYVDLLTRIEDDTIILTSPHRYPGFDPRSVQADLDEALRERDLVAANA